MAVASLVGQDSESMESIPLVSLASLAERVTQLERVVEQIAGAPVPQIFEGVDGLQHVPQERVQNRTPEQIVDVLVPLLTEAIVEVMPSLLQESVQNRTPEQFVDEPVHQIAEEIVERPVPSERIHELLRALQELRRRNLEQNAFEEEEEDEEEMEVSRFPPHFRPRRWCRFVQAGGVCPRGWQCTFAHHESELHPDSW